MQKTHRIISKGQNHDIKRPSWSYIPKMVQWLELEDITKLPLRKAMDTGALISPEGSSGTHLLPRMSSAVVSTHRQVYTEPSSMMGEMAIVSAPSNCLLLFTMHARLSKITKRSLSEHVNSVCCTPIRKGVKNAAQSLCTTSHTAHQKQIPIRGKNPLWRQMGGSIFCPSDDNVQNSLC